MKGIKSIFGEIPEIYSFPDLFSVKFFLLMTAGGIFGFAIGYVTGLQVKVCNRKNFLYLSGSIKDT